MLVFICKITSKTNSQFKQEINNYLASLTIKVIITIRALL